VNEMESHYSLLQVDPSADPEVIESAYRRLARKYHPDVSRSPEAEVRMRAINLAYATLSNPGRRAIYDRQLRQNGIRQRLSGRRPSAWPRAAGQDGADPAPGPGPGDGRAALQGYRRSARAVETQAATCLRSWAAEWADCLEALLGGDSRARQRAAEAAQRCLAGLGECLERWESLAAPPRAQRLNDLGGACLKLELALVRGTLSLAEGGDFSVLEPLAGLAERIGALTTTISAESTLVGRLAA
jgi:curved DNA-binding protein CbpA